MPRPRLNELRADWKLSLPAPTAAQADLLLEDPLTQKPRYGSRSKLVNALLLRWFAEVRGDQNLPSVPTLAELRSSE